MIEVYSWPTPNGHKVHIMLEECGLPYRAHPVDIGAGDQFKPEFLAISPNNKIPAITDPDGPDGQPISLFESGAILLYLAGKTGRFLPADTRGKYEVLQWLMFQMGGVGPMLGQAHHFRIYAPEKIPYAIERYTNEAKRLYGVMNKRLAKSRYLGGPTTASPTSPSFPGCAAGRTRASTGTTTRTSKAGSTRSPHAPRSSAAWRCWPTCASPSRATRSARSSSASGRSSSADPRPQPAS
jgi:GST-like protein